jgi:hypothetical protein
MRPSISRADIEHAVRKRMADKCNTPLTQKTTQEVVAKAFGKRDLTGDEKQIVDEVLRMIGKEIQR